MHSSIAAVNLALVVVGALIARPRKCSFNLGVTGVFFDRREWISRPTVHSPQGLPPSDPGGQPLPSRPATTYPYSFSSFFFSLAAASSSRSTRSWWTVVARSKPAS